ncbi:hypothetical protein HHK36_027500 [Tetracentron sinense]|uniref:Uncharacterized protein n=1 Tax=Tetracentron sinense TaxID=13715 RepID=A0A834YGT4_TETSI|nr:hypothetical protein HHK36_027500 [Tetracentron sinense]
MEDQEAEKEEILEIDLLEKFSTILAFPGVDIVVEIEENESTKEGESICRSALFGKFLAERPVNLQIAKKTILQAWRLPYELEVLDLEDDVFLFKFKGEKDTLRILSHEPWCFNGHLLCLQRWKPDIAVKEIDFSKSPFWIQFHGIPVAKMTYKTGNQLGAYVGDVLEVDLPRSGLSQGRFVRVRVLVQLDKPLRPWIMLKRDRPLPDLKIEIKYERLPSFCFFCGRIGHDEIHCTIKLEMPEKLLEIFRSESRFTLFNKKLRADTFRGKLRSDVQSSRKTSYKEGETSNTGENRRNVNFLMIEVAEEDDRKEFLSEKLGSSFNGQDQMEYIQKECLRTIRGKGLCQERDWAGKNISLIYRQEEMESNEYSNQNGRDVLMRPIGQRDRSEELVEEGPPTKKNHSDQSEQLITEVEIGGKAKKGWKLKNLKSRLGYANALLMDSNGLSGGLALFWNDQVNLTVTESTSNKIETEIVHPETAKIWDATFVYGPTNEFQRRDLWDNIKFSAGKRNRPWMCCGDFNDIVSVREKEGGVPKAASKIRNFTDMLNGANLLDLGFQGPRFTWSNRQENEKCIWERLDRFVANISWREMFEEATVYHLLDIGSDHRPVLLDTEKQGRSITVSLIQTIQVSDPSIEDSKQWNGWSLVDGLASFHHYMFISHLPSLPNLSEGVDGHLEPEEDENEDVDFNPFLKEIPSSEASSSLSSENEGLDADVVDYVGNSSASKESNSLSKLTIEVKDSASRYSENDEEVLMQTRVSPKRACGKDSEDAVPGKLKNRNSALTQAEIGSIPGKENSSINVTDAAYDVMKGELSDQRYSRNPSTDLEDGDAICRRTRARYSLANFTLDELETFLQETDDDDDLQNVNDEEEYRKFLAAVLQGGDSEVQAIQGNENFNDEDEDNDADFEIEIEEALESDPDESIQGKDRKEKYEGSGRRPKTRQNRRQKMAVQNKKKLLGQAKRPLRPLLPFVPNAPIAPFPALDCQRLMPDTGLHCPSSSAQAGLVNGFTPHQVGQLHCLIHEHVQLLIQVFSLCVLEPSRQHIAGEVRGLISEMVHKRDEVLAWRKLPYPGFCFCPPYIHPSASDGLSRFCQVQYTVDSSLAPDTQNDSPSVNNVMPDSHNTSPSEARYDEHVPGRHVDPLQTSAIEDSFWLPLISGPILSILDVAPLNIVGRYMADVSTAVQQHQQRHVEAISDTRFQKEPLFPLPNFPSFAEGDSEVLRGATVSGPNTAPSSSPSCQKPKKTLAAALVERTKKQSVALVPKEIVKLAQRFFTLFNSALFPHKPPPAAVANRVLFTDAEDELLAMGLMEYNTDWKAIQQRFLPCKSKHQIFVRQKNRCSSKAPENPIKAVRQMKTSPLTAEEKARIHEGLRVLKLDWMSIWKFIVPYRDPSLLPRQWRTALGTQKSYKTDAAKKEKRRLYESNRRKCKAMALASWQTVSEKEDYPTDNADGGNNSGDDIMDNVDEAYVHEAFLADWRPGNSRVVPSELPFSNLSKRNFSGDLLPQEGAHIGEKPAGHWYGESQPQNGYMHEFMSASNLQNASHFTHVRYSASYTMASNHLVSDRISKSSKRQVHLRPYRVRRSNAVQLVKLAPDLPPVNLPPSVRVISQSAFKSYHCGSSTKVSGGDGAGTEDVVPRLPHVAKLGADRSIIVGKNRNIALNDATNLFPQDPGLPTDQCVTDERGAESDLQMHPLLFQASEDGCLPYYPLNRSTTTASSFSFIPGNQLQAHLNLFHKPHHVGPAVDCYNKSLQSKETPSTSCTIDFHPLFQRTDTINSDSVTASSAAHLSIDLESFRGNCAQLRNPSNTVLIEPQVNSGPLATEAENHSPYEKVNELDLEMHLSSTSRKDKATGSRDVTEHNYNRPTISSLDSGITGECQNADRPYYQSSKNCSAASIATRVNNNGLVPRGLASNIISRYTEDNVGDQSLPEIVMEQEELSDSDEEVGEHVEFECEEMDDSEGEGSDCEQLVYIQNKEGPTVAVEKEVVTNRDSNDRQCEPRIWNALQGNVCVTAKGNTRSRKLGLTGKGKDITSSTLHLSLDSCTLGCSPRTKPKCQESVNGDDQIAKNYSLHGAPSRSNRSCKRMTLSTKGATTQAHPLGTPQQLHLGTAEGTPAATPIRKPRKRVRRNACRSMITTTTMGNSSIVSSDDLVDCCTDDTSPRDDGEKMDMGVIFVDHLPTGEANMQEASEPKSLTR